MLERGTDKDRLATLAQYGLLDTPPERQFDEIVESARQQTGTPISTISLIDARRQWFKARLGLDSWEGPIEESFCARAIESDAMLVVPDASIDPHFHDYPNVTGGPGIRFYAGAPLKMRNGERIGTLCVIDVVPRDGLNDDERAALEDLARRTVAAFELRRDLIEAGHASVLPAPDRQAWLTQASVYLAKAWAALDQVGATASIAHLEQVIVDVDAMRMEGD